MLQGHTTDVAVIDCDVATVAPASVAIAADVRVKCL